jgi:hypothetical protein
VCQRLFYLLNDDYVEDGAPVEVTAVAVFQPLAVELPDPDLETAPAGAPQVSLHALAGVRTENAMVLHITVKGHQLVAPSTPALRPTSSTRTCVLGSSSL